MSPRPCLAMKLIASGVTNSAASVRSPSFSRSSSSTTTTIRPAFISSTASITLANIPSPFASNSFDASHHKFVAKKNAALAGGVSYQTKIYRVDSISKPQASSSASGIYFEFLFRRAHSRSRVERMYWSGVSLNSFTTCSNDVTVGTTGPIGSGLPQLGFPRRFAIFISTSLKLSFRTSPCEHWEKTQHSDSKVVTRKKQGAHPGKIRRNAPIARNLHPVLALLSGGIKLHHIRLQLLQRLHVQVNHVTRRIVAKLHIPNQIRR